MHQLLSVSSAAACDSLEIGLCQAQHHGLGIPSQHLIVLLLLRPSRMWIKTGRCRRCWWCVGIIVPSLSSMSAFIFPDAPRQGVSGCFGSFLRRGWGWRGCRNRRKEPTRAPPIRACACNTYHSVPKNKTILYTNIRSKG